MIYGTKTFTKKYAVLKECRTSAREVGVGNSTSCEKWHGAQKAAREKTDLEHDLDHKKLHAKRPIWGTIWSTKSCTRKHPSGARFGAQKVTREKTHLEHDLDHKKLHAKRPIWSTIWTTKSCTRKDPSGARFGARKVARKKSHLEHDLEHKNLQKHGKKPYPIMQNDFVFCAIFGVLQKSGQPVQSVLQFVNCQLCRMAAMSKMARHCEEDIANNSQSTRIAYSKINHFGGDVFAGGPTNKTLLLTVTDIRLESIPMSISN